MRGQGQIGIVGKLFIALLLVGIGVTSMSYYWGDLANTYNIDNTENITSLDVAKNITERQKALKESVDQEFVSENDNPGVLWEGAVNSLKLVFGAGDDATNFITAASDDVGIDDKTTDSMILILMGVIALAIIGALLKWKL